MGNVSVTMVEVVVVVEMVRKDVVEKVVVVAVDIVMTVLAGPGTVDMGRMINGAEILKVGGIGRFPGKLPPFSCLANTDIQQQFQSQGLEPQPDINNKDEVFINKIIEKVCPAPWK